MPPSVFRKLNLKTQQEIVVVNAPESFEAELAALDSVHVLREPGKAKTVEFALAFATTRAELDRLSEALSAKAEGDAVLWIAYPKQTSRRYTCEFNRDSGWKVLGDAGFEPVRQVAIDEDWSALRFRRVEYIKSMTRDPRRKISGKRSDGK
jgi:hypothetical protein